MTRSSRNLPRNIAIIAHVDHGKTTMVDQLLRQSGIFRENQYISERIMDSNDIERERGITILSKNCSVEYKGTQINIVDTPGHADFGGEVERVLSMVDSVLLLVDAVEGTMPQTRFVTNKALALGLKPIVVINKIDRPCARIDWVINQTFDLFDKLGATEEQLDFPIVYASGLNGYASLDSAARDGDMRPLFDAILSNVSVRNADPEGPFQMQITSLDYSAYIGKIGVGRIARGRIKPGQTVVMRFGPEGNILNRKVNQVMSFNGLERVQVEEAKAGDIILINGIEDIRISATICAPDMPEALPIITVDEPTLTMNFLVNSSPLAGREGKFITSRQIRNRLKRELNHNVALRVNDTCDETVFEVSGRGELHLSILIENMRREGYELAVSRPRVVMREINGVNYEPYELLIIDIEEKYNGSVMEELSYRKGEILDIMSDGHGCTRLEYRIPTRGLIGFQSEFLILTRGKGLISHIFDSYKPVKDGFIGRRKKGVLISQDDGEAVAYALWKLQDRGRMFVRPGDMLYEGMIIGIHSRDNDLVVNPIKGKQLTNVRASGTDEAVHLAQAIQMSIEYAVEFIDEDELVEVTPKSIRLRKRYLKEHERRQARREFISY
ncbi:MAG: translational GTPase TypA [Burkholderia sp.]|nr:translational GTPase TypA [Burkholderia sp.]